MVTIIKLCTLNLFSTYLWTRIGNPVHHESKINISWNIHFRNGFDLTYNWGQKWCGSLNQNFGKILPLLASVLVHFIKVYTTSFTV